jgi:DNA-binding protein HU-beta
MTRDELSRRVADRTGLTQREARSALDATLDAITDTLCEGDSVYLRGFGCFETRRGRQRRARDPRGEGLIRIPPKVRPTFRAYDGLKERIQERLAPRVDVSFLCLGASDADYVSVVGGFNGWSEEATPMQRLPDGSWVAEVSLQEGRTIVYRYNIDGSWEPDPAFPADDDGNTVRQV